MCNYESNNSFMLYLAAVSRFKNICCSYLGYWVNVVCRFWWLFYHSGTTLKVKRSHLPLRYTLKLYTTLHYGPNNARMLSLTPVRLLKNICCSYPGNWVNVVCAQATMYCTCRSWTPLEIWNKKTILFHICQNVFCRPKNDIEQEYWT